MKQNADAATSSVPVRYNMTQAGTGMTRYASGLRYWLPECPCPASLLPAPPLVFLLCISGGVSAKAGGGLEVEATLKNDIKRAWLLSRTLYMYKNFKDP